MPMPLITSVLGDVVISATVKRSRFHPPELARRRRTHVRLFGVMAFCAIAVDPSIYVGGLFHLYVHDLISVLAGAYGVALAVEHRSIVPAGRLLWVPLGLLGFLITNTLLLGALQYQDLAPEMHKLFWFEHGNALRIVAELFIWIWALAQLAPNAEESWSILDLASWAAAINIAALGGYWLVTNTQHAATTTADLDVMVGLPMAIVFVITLGRRRDFFRLVVFGAGSNLLYSRTSIVAVIFTTALVLLTARRWRSLTQSAVAIAIGWLLVLAIPAAITWATPALDATLPATFPPAAVGSTTVDRALSIVNTDLAPYTIPSRLAIWTDALRIFKISPVVGIGYHDYFIFSRVTEVKDASRFDNPELFSSLIKQAHNDLLSWLAETGGIGLAFYLAFWLAVLWAALGLWRAEPAHRTRHTYELALVTSLLGVSMFGEILIPRTPEWMSSAILWWIVIGIVLVGATRREVVLRADR